MKILILNGDTRPGNTALAAYLAKFEAGLKAEAAEVSRMDLAALDIRFCTGCWSCWWATPGRCVFRDGMENIYPAVLESDLLVWASPLVLGTVPTLVKKTQDRFIPLLHPYFELVQGEVHHRLRYDRYPSLGLIVEARSEDSGEDLSVVRRLFERFGVNMHVPLKLFASTDSMPEEAAREALTA
jgi:multimeric flavodoxin WrbA